MVYGIPSINRLNYSVSQFYCTLVSKKWARTSVSLNYANDSRRRSETHGNLSLSNMGQDVITWYMLVVYAGTKGVMDERLDYRYRIEMIIICVYNLRKYCTDRYSYETENNSIIHGGQTGRGVGGDIIRPASKLTSILLLLLDIWAILLEATAPKRCITHHTL